MASSSSRFSAARPKRAGDHFTRTHHLDPNEPSAKKPRFDPRNPSTLAPDNDEDDPTLDADVIGKSGGVKRSAVNIDGYDSDSSTENFEARAEARTKQKVVNEEEEDDDDDMFADDKDDDQDEETRRGDGGDQKKNVRFLDDEDIVGQEDTSKSGGHVAGGFGGHSNARAQDRESSTDSEDDDEGRDMLDPHLDEELGAGSKKKHAPKLDAFNMKAEQEEGRFDAAGNYIRQAQDPLAKHDAWLDGVTKKQMKKAKEAQEKREAQLRERERASDAIVASDELSKMLLYLEVGETPMEALARYGKAIPQKKTTSSYAGRRKKKQEMDVDQEAAPAPDPAVTEAATKAKQAIDDITDTASHLTDRGIEDIYELSRESIMRHYKRETGEDWKHPNPPKIEYEFRWLEAPDAIQGPYDEKTMRHWAATNAFARGAEFRKVGDYEWSYTLDFDDDD